MEGKTNEEVLSLVEKRRTLLKRLGTGNDWTFDTFTTRQYYTRQYYTRRKYRGKEEEVGLD